MNVVLLYAYVGNPKEDKLLYTLVDVLVEGYRNIV
jgi:hypothetical protein